MRKIISNISRSLLSVAAGGLIYYSLIFDVKTASLPEEIQQNSSVEFLTQIEDSNRMKKDKMISVWTIMIIISLPGIIAEKKKEKITQA